MRVVALAFMVASVAAGSARAADLQPSSTILFDAAYAGRARGDAGFTYQPGAGLVRWTLGDTLSPDQTRGLVVSTATLEANPLASLLRPSKATGADAFELAYVRNWPAAVNLQAGRLALDITPHASVGLSSAGSQLAEIGAMARVGLRMMEAIGAGEAVHGSKLFLFAGASRRSTGLNLLKSQNLQRKIAANGVGDGSVREAEAGLGFRNGALSASLGYTYEKTRLKALGGDAYGVDRFGLTVTVKPFR